MKTLSWFKKEWLIAAIILAPFALIALYWGDFPAQVPTHWKMNGQPGQFMDKGIGLFIGPGINLLIYFLLFFIQGIDPLKKNVNTSANFRKVRLIVHAFLSFIFVCTVFNILGKSTDMGIMVEYGLLAFFIILGNFITTVKRNYFVGIRTPWTLTSDENWMKTHRFGGKLWVFGSMAALIVSIFIPLKLYFLPYIIIISLVPVAYSFILFKTLPKNTENHV